MTEATWRVRVTFPNGAERISRCRGFATWTKAAARIVRDAFAQAYAKRGRDFSAEVVITACSAQKTTETFAQLDVLFGHWNDGHTALESLNPNGEPYRVVLERE